MSENNGNHEGEQAGGRILQRHRIVVTFDESNGAVGLEGVPQNQILALGMLSGAIAMISAIMVAPNASASPILRPPRLL